MILTFFVFIGGFKIVPAFIDPNEALWKEAATASENDYFETMVDFLLWIGAEPKQEIEKYGISPIQEAVFSKNMALILKLTEKFSAEEKKKVCDYSMNNSHRSDINFTERLCEELK